MARRCILLRDHPHPSHILGIATADHPLLSPTLITVNGGALIKAQLVRVSDKVIAYREIETATPPTEADKGPQIA